VVSQPPCDLVLSGTDFELSEHITHISSNLRCTAGKIGNMGRILLMQEGNILEWIMLKKFMD